MKSKWYKDFRLSIVLFSILSVLKLTGVIGWSWWWITLPLWIPIVFVAMVALSIIFLISIVALFPLK